MMDKVLNFYLKDLKLWLLNFYDTAFTKFKLLIVSLSREIKAMAHKSYRELKYVNIVAIKKLIINSN